MSVWKVIPLFSPLSNYSFCYLDCVHWHLQLISSFFLTTHSQETSELEEMESGPESALSHSLNTVISTGLQLIFLTIYTYHVFYRSSTSAYTSTLCYLNESRLSLPRTMFALLNSWMLKDIYTYILMAGYILTFKSLVKGSF